MFGSLGTILAGVDQYLDRLDTLTQIVERVVDSEAYTDKQKNDFIDMATTLFAVCRADVEKYAKEQAKESKEE